VDGPGRRDEITVEAYGARGGDGSGNISGPDVTLPLKTTGDGGNGGYVSGDYSVSPGDVVTMRIGGRGSDGGWPDGGDGPQRSVQDGYPEIQIDTQAGSGGGSTSVDVEGTEILRAGGGGGGGASCTAVVGLDPSGSTNIGDGGYAHTQNGGDGSTNASDRYNSASATANGGGAGGSDNGGGDAVIAGADGEGRGIGVGGGGGGGDRVGYGGGVGSDGQQNLNVAAAGSGGAGTEFIHTGVSNASTQNDVTSPNNGTAGQVTIEYELPPEPPSDFTVSGGSRETTLTWTNDPDGYDSIEVYRATQSGGKETADYTLVETIGGANESYADSGLLDGERYFYRLRPVAGGLTLDFSNEADATTYLPAPTALNAIDERSTEADVSWTDNHNNGGVRVEYREDDAGEWVVDQTVAREVEQATVDGLLNGQLYGIRVVAQTTDAETEDE